MYDLTMQNAHRLAIVRSLHTESAIAMALSKFVLFYGGVISAVGVWLWVAVTLIAIEVVAFVGNGMGVSADGSRRAVWPQTGHALMTYAYVRYKAVARRRAVATAPQSNGAMPLVSARSVPPLPPLPRDTW